MFYCFNFDLCKITIKSIVGFLKFTRSSERIPPWHAYCPVVSDSTKSPYEAMLATLLRRKEYTKIYMELKYKDHQVFRSSYPYRGMMDDGSYNTFGYFICGAEQWDEERRRPIVELLFFDPLSSKWSGYVANTALDAFIDFQSDDIFYAGANPPRLDMEDLENFIRWYCLIYITYLIIS